MISSEVFSSIILVSVILVVGILGAQIYTSYHNATMISFELKDVESFFRALVYNLNSLTPMVYEFSLKHGIIEFYANGFQYLFFNNETIFASYVFIIRYNCIHRIYPSQKLIIHSGNLTYLSYSIIGYDNHLELHLYPIFMSENDSIIVYTIVFNVNSSLKIVEGAFSFTPKLSIIKRSCSFLEPRWVYTFLQYKNDSFQRYYLAHIFHPLILYCGVILVDVKG
ncbi:MAG: hypothetical protein QXI93_00355 [Candidatus Methanomethylicia archaeon]